MEMIIVAAIGVLGAVMANKGIAVFNDGLRPIMPENLEGRMSRKELAATAFAMSFGLVIGFGIPFSLTSSIVLIHSIFLGTDIIGTFTPSDNKGTILAGILGGLYGIGIVRGLEAVVNLFEYLPVNFIESLGEVGNPVVVSFAVFPALATAYQFGVKKGLLNLAISLLARQIAVIVSPISLGTASISLNTEGMALIAGMIVLLFFAIREKSEEEGVDLASVFAERVSRIRKNIVILMLTGGLVAAATSYTIIAGDPISLNLAAEGNFVDAGFTALARGIGFIPLIASTAIATGVYGPVGMTFVFAIGFFIKNPLIAFIAGTLMMGLEVIVLDKLGNTLDKYPGIRSAGDNIRNAMTALLEVALLVGGMNAANAIAPGLGFFVVAGLFILNEIAGRPIVKMAVGPVAAIVVGILVNILNIIGLFNIPA